MGFCFICIHSLAGRGIFLLVGSVSDNFQKIWIRKTIFCITFSVQKRMVLWILLYSPAYWFIAWSVIEVLNLFWFICFQISDLGWNLHRLLYFLKTLVSNLWFTMVCFIFHHITPLPYEYTSALPINWLSMHCVLQVLSTIQFFWTWWKIINSKVDANSLFTFACLIAIIFPKWKITYL